MNVQPANERKIKILKVTCFIFIVYPIKTIYRWGKIGKGANASLATAPNVNL